MNQEMTIFYSENTGEIKLVSSGDVDFDIFLQNEADMRSFCKKAVVNLNESILRNSHEYIVDLKANKIIKKPVENIEISLQ